MAADILDFKTGECIERGAPPVPGIDPEYAEFERELLREKKRLMRKEGVPDREAAERAYILIRLTHGPARVEAAIERHRKQSQ